MSAKPTRPFGWPQEGNESPPRVACPPGRSAATLNPEASLPTDRGMVECEMAEVVFITGTNTEVGKTLFTALMLKHLRNAGYRALAMKPFATGRRADAALLAAIQDHELPIDVVNPYAYRKAVAPWVAAREEGRRIELRQAVESVQSISSKCEVVLIEGCGGLLAPLGPGYTNLDLIAALRTAVIIVARNELGVLNHALLTLSALKSSHLRRVAVVLMGSRRRDSSTETNQGALTELVAPTPVISVPYLGPNAATVRGVERSARALEKILQKTLALALGSGRFSPAASVSSSSAVSKKKSKKPLTAAEKAVR